MAQKDFVKWILTDYEYFHAMAEKDPSTLYFLEDTHEIYKGDVCYTQGIVLINSADDFPEYGGNNVYVYDKKLYMHDGDNWFVILDASGTGGEGGSITVLTEIDPYNLKGEAVSDDAVVKYVKSIIMAAATADEVLTTQNIVVKNPIGKYDIGDTIAIGTSVQDIIIGMSEPPKSYVLPEVSFGYSPIEDIEVGVSSKPITIMPKYTQNDGGAISKVEVSTTVDGLTAVVFTDTAIPEEGIVVNPIIPHRDSKVTVTTTVAYNAGAKPDKVPAKEVSSTKEFNVFRYIYSIADTNIDAELTNDTIIGLNKTRYDVNQFEVVVPAFSNRVLIAVPSEKVVKSIKSDMLGFNVLDTFEKASMSLTNSEDTEGTEHFYTVFLYTTKVPFPGSDTYVVTFED